ncbi:MAG: dephospho-CoA kinase [Candidatus Acidiferrales bacterium]|jgi:dephospho-CoA kinase
MLRVGLTGGIACGKSTVASMLRDLDMTILDADPIVHEMLESGQPVYDEVVREFGSEILTSDKKIDRAKLGAIVFADRERLDRLNQIIHPRVMDVITKWFAALDRAGGTPLAIVEAALLVEAGYREKLDRLIVVRCDPEQQMARLRARGLTEEQARQRIAAQMPVDEKARIADDVINTTGSIEETRRQVEQLADNLKRLGWGAPAE